MPMKKETFMILALIIWGMGMILWTFFGWNNSDWDTIQNDSTWFIEQLTETWTSNNINNPETWNIQLEQESTHKSSNSDKWYTEIRLMMPRYFYTAWWKSFAQKLYKDQKVYIKFEFVDNLDLYKTNISNKNFSWADIVLFPYDRIDNVPTRSFSFQQSVESAFDPLVSPIVKNTKIAFLPFSADPMLTYSISWYLAQPYFSDIVNVVYDWNSVNSFPLFFWLTSDDSYNEWFRREYQDIAWYALMHYFTTYRDSNSLDLWLTSNVFENYNTENLNLILNAIPVTECKNFPSVCFQVFNFVGIRFWFLSDKDIVKQYFQWKINNYNKVKKDIMPFFSLEQPVRIRWFSMPGSLEDTNTINAVYLFLSEYMRSHTDDMLGSTLSVFKWSSLSDNEFITSRWYILESWWNYINNMKGNKLFWQLIEYQITANNYLKKI